MNIQDLVDLRDKWTNEYNTLHAQYPIYDKKTFEWNQKRSYMAGLIVAARDLNDLLEEYDPFINH